MIAIILIAYLLGSIPFGLLLTKFAGLGDIRQVGSGNIGATNVMRTGHKGLGIATLLLDGGKGYLAVWIVQHIALALYVPDKGWTAIALAGAFSMYIMGGLGGLFAVLGHIFPVWLKFKGGKGVATAIGALLALSWQSAGLVCMVWLLAFAFSRMASVASLASLWIGAGLAYIFINGYIALFCLILAALITWTHRANIARIRAGTEKAFRKEAL